MIKIILLFCLYCYPIYSDAQKIENPAFEKSDIPAFHIRKVEITKDTTYVFCLYYAEVGSWASISKDTYLRDSKSHRSFPILRCAGLPYSPETRTFSQNESCELLFCFPSIAGIEQFDFIESEGQRAFNIYNINLKRSYKTSYTDAELQQISEMVSAYDSSSDTEKTKLLKDYATSLNNLVSYNVSLGNYVEAIRLAVAELKIRGMVWGDEHPSYIELLGNLVEYNSSIGNYLESLRFGTEQIETMKKVGSVEPSENAGLLCNLAKLNSILGNYSKAVTLEREAVEIYKKIIGTDDPAYATSLINLAGYYQDSGNYDEAFRLLMEAKNIYKSVFGAESVDYAVLLNNLADYYSKVGNYSDAIRFGIEAMELYKRLLGSEHYLYAISLVNLTNYYSLINNYPEAIRYGSEAVGLYKNVLGTNHPNYATLLNNLAIVNSEVGNYSEAMKLGTEAMEFYKTALGTEHPDYARSLNSLAWYNSMFGNFNEAIRLGLEAMEIRKKVLGIEHPLYATSLLNLAIYNARINNYSEAIRLGSEATAILEILFGTEHPTYVTSLDNLARYYIEQGKYLEAYNCMQLCLINSQSIVLRNFTNLSSRNQETMWVDEYAYRFNTKLPNIVVKYQTKQSLSELYNKACLFAKSLLLNTSLEIRKLILESGDSIIIDNYEALSSNISLYNKLLEKQIQEHLIDVDSLNSVIEQQEMVLARESKIYGDYTHNLTISWKDVQSRLGDNDIAIEFLDFPVFNTDSTMYVALTLKKNYDNPHMVTLFEADQLTEIPEDDYYTRTDVANLVWKPLEEELKGVKNIYFAPSGELHRIGVEYLPISKTENICDIYTLHRLSSTRQLAVIQGATEGKNIILYGGIDYDEKSNAILTDYVSTKGYVLRRAFSRANVDSLSLRSSFDYLEGTKKEADMIAKDMKEHRVPYIYYSGIDGSEESFKQLDGTKPKVIHIATHGFYLTEAETEKSKFARDELELMTERNQIAGRTVEDKPMTRSGLLFSGCNRAFRHEQIPEGEEDGILTAQEISMLDLRGLDLVVLSACQTGLGDVVSGEGVFGLQRGFKMAGANTILMSLNKVDDEATRILIVEFYRNLMNGKTKRQSLQEAQQYLRKVEKGKYDEPKYWASFIMLDGLD